MPKPQPITPEQLRLAFRQVSRPGWPATLQAVLDHPVYSVCLRGMARNLTRRGMGRKPVRSAPPVLPPLPLFDQAQLEESPRA